MKYRPPINGDTSDPNRGWPNAVPGVSEGAKPDGRAIEDPQREIENAIIAAGLTPDHDDLTQLAQVIQSSGALSSGTTTNVASAYTVAGAGGNLGTAFTRFFLINFNVGNAGAATLNYKGAGVKNVKDFQGNTLTANRLPAGPRVLVYDGTDFRALDLDNPIAQIRDEKASGTNGGTGTLSAWNGRTLNTIVKNEIPGLSLSGNQITLPPGEYKIRAKAPAWRSATSNPTLHKLRLKNVTDTTYLYGQSETTLYGVSYAHIEASVIITAQKIFSLEQYLGGYVESGDLVLGYAGAIAGVSEVYSEINIEKVR